MTSEILPHILAGLGMGFSLLIAIGAQNIYLLRQGIMRRYVLLTVLVCAIADAVLIVLGISGVGKIVEQLPVLVNVVRWFGVAFLIWYAFLAIRRVIRGEALVMEGSADSSGGLLKALGAVLALTFLNPHVYLDTVLLLGSIGTTHGEPGRWYFAIGAVAASFIWFFAIGFGARLLVPVFRSKKSWRILDSCTALIMLAIAANLAFMKI